MTFRKGSQSQAIEEWGDGGPVEAVPTRWECVALGSFLLAGWGSLIWYAGVVVGWWAP